MTINKITINGDEEAKSFCLGIAREIARLFEIPISEAIGRVNKFWVNQTFVGPQMIYHRDEQFWANTIYYEDGTYWWLDWWMAKNTPKPRLYP